MSRSTRFANFLSFHPRFLLQNQIRTTLCITCGSPALILTVLLPEMPQNWMIVSESRFSGSESTSNQLSQLPPRGFASKSTPSGFMHHLWIPSPHIDRPIIGCALKMDKLSQKVVFLVSEHFGCISEPISQLPPGGSHLNLTRTALCIACGTVAFTLSIPKAVIAVGRRQDPLTVRFSSR